MTNAAAVFAAEPTTTVDSVKRRIETRWVSTNGTIEVALSTSHDKDRKHYRHFLSYAVVEQRDGYKVRQWTSGTATASTITPVARHSKGALDAAHADALAIMGDIENAVFDEAAEAASQN